MAVRFALGLTVHAPLALLVLLMYTAVVAVMHRFHPGTLIRLPSMRTAGLVVLCALLVQAVGTSFIGTRYETVGRILSVYPMSLISYVVPDAVWDFVPEAFLFLCGSASALMVTSVALYLSMRVFARIALLMRSRERAA